MKVPIYFDYAATTPVDPRVAQKMSECLMTEGNFGNPASRSHKFGWEAEEAVEVARRQVADLVNCDPREIVWTSGATESDNLAIKGVAQFYKKKGKHLITSKIEHKAVLDTCRHLERDGFEVTYLEPGEDGLVRADQVQQAGGDLGVDQVGRVRHGRGDNDEDTAYQDHRLADDGGQLAHGNLAVHEHFDDDDIEGAEGRCLTDGDES